MSESVSNFTFGFELEAIIDPLRNCLNQEFSEIQDKNIIENHFADKREVIVPEEAKKVILYLKQQFGGKAVTDSSIKPEIENHFPFEYVSDPEELSTDVLERLQNLLVHITKNGGVYGNETCGFHFHFSYEGITKFDLIWIKLFYLFDNRSEKFSSFMTTAGEVGLWSDQYANQGNIKARKSEFQNIVSKMNNVGDENFQHQFNEFFAQAYFSSKYTVFGIHDKYRTLEWRGPRGFLNNNEQDIIRFINLLRDFSEWLAFARFQNSISVGGIILKRAAFRKLFLKIAQPQFIHFGIDIALAVDAAENDEDKVSAMIEFFRSVDLQSRHATNLRKIGNRIKERHPEAWNMMLERLSNSI